jgi:PAS domain S-box-containing protein
MNLTSYSTFPPRKEDEPQASSILENITDGFIALDSEWRYVYVNAEAERLHGMSREEHLGKVIWDLFPGMLGTAIYEKLHRAVSEGIPVECENYCEAGDQWFRVKAYPRQEGGLSIYFRDVTAQRRAEAIQQQAQEALRESEARLNAIVGQATVGIAEEDLAGRFTLVNDYFCTMLGRTREEMLTLSLEDVTHPDDLPLTLEAFHKGIAQGSPYTLEKRWRRPDGSVIWANNSVNVIPGADGKPSRVVLISVDITERKRVERELQSSEERFRTMADALPQLVWTCTPEGECDYLSPQWKAYTGLGDEETLGFRWLDAVLHPDDRERTLEAWMQAVTGKAEYDVEYRMRRHDGVYRWFKARATPFRNGHDEIVKWFGTSTDIDGQICTERELRRANQDLEQFAFSASHDLQEPLRMVSIFSQMLRKKYAGQLDGEADEFIDYITRGASQMEMLLKDLLT